MLRETPPAEPDPAERARAGLAAHPLARQAAPFLEGEVSAVGGAVRDALIDREPGTDLDLVVEGDAIALGRRLGEALEARTVTHERFGTAELELPDGGRIDLAAARRERYASPGELPTIEAGSLEEDLSRRDFSVNAIALGLAGARAGALIDPHRGAADLEAGALRILRLDAFEEDPSRVVRAARYSARLGLRPDPVTEQAALAAAPALDPAGARVADELRRLLEEGPAAGGLDLLAAWGVRWARAGRGAHLDAVDAALAAPGAPMLPAWALRLGLGVAQDAITRSALPGWARELALQARAGAGLADRLAGARAPSEVDRLLAVASEAAAVAALAAGAERVAEWWAHERDLRLAIDGSDLLAAGAAPGPAIGRALAATRAALLDGRVGEGRREQLELALREAGAG